MEARFVRAVLLVALLLVSMGARYQSANFTVETADPRMAEQLGQAAEKFRHDLAIEWTGQAMPNWSQPCMMTVQVGPHLGAGGATTFIFDRGEVFGWRMNIQGSAERLLDSVLPHEVTHMIYASYFRRPLPRWADEGGATSMEHSSEKQKHRAMLVQFLRTGRGIAFGQMFAMTEYPHDVMPLYAQSYSLSEYLIQHGGRRKYIAFLADGMNEGQWAAAVKRHYGIGDLASLQNTWVAWVAQGFPEPKAAPTAIAAATPAARPATVTPASTTTALRPRAEPNLIYRVRDKDHAADNTQTMVPVQASSPIKDSQAAMAPAAPPMAVAVPAEASLETGWQSAAGPQVIESPPPPAFQP